MALSTQDQIKQQLETSTSILIALPQEPTTDAICAALTMRAILESQKKQVVIVSDEFKAPAKLDFIKSLNHILPSLDAKKKYIIEIDTEASPVEDLSYQLNNGKLQIVLTPKGEPIKKESIQLHNTIDSFDLIVTINTVELATLGNFAKEHAALLEQTPIINIDHRPDNEHYGQINWVDINATSTCELLTQYFFSEKKPSKGLATILLAGMMDETHSFRTAQVNSAALQLVSMLLEAGADHETIVNNLYRTKTVGLLKLWGHVLNHLQADREHSLAWSMIPESVFSTTGTDKRHLHDLMHEVLAHSPEAKTVVLFLEQKDGSIMVQVSCLPPLHAKDLIKNWQPQGSERIATATLKGENLAQAEEQVIRLIKERLATILRTK